MAVMQIAILAYPGMTALDAIGPYEMLRGLPDAELRFVWHEPGPVVTDSGVLALGATHSFGETAAPDIVLVGGSIPATMSTAADEGVLTWLQQAHQTTTWTAPVCSGSLILGAAGILQGKNATCHWAGQRVLSTFGANAQRDKRIVRDGKVVTAAGVSAGLDLGLWLVGEIAGRPRAEATQLCIEYDPQPPFDTGHMNKASTRNKADAVRMMKGMISARDAGTELVAGSKVMWANVIDRMRKRSAANP